MRFSRNHTLLLFAATIGPTLATTKCSSNLQPVNGIQPSAASGYSWSLVATGLSTPRSLQFDSDNNLWVLESGKGVTKHYVVDNGCVSLNGSNTIVSDPMLNHGMVLRGDRLIVSSTSIAYQVTLDNKRQSVVANSNRTLVMNMENSDHVTRTLLLAGNHSLIVSRGSDDNIDTGAAAKNSSRAAIKMFDLSQSGAPFDYDTCGRLLGWGLRNDVGMALHPTTHGLFTVENSADNIERDGVDVHTNNPAEEMNFLGTIDPAKMSAFKPKFYGYPNCFTAWAPSELPDNSSLKVGSPFALNSSGDAACVAHSEPARLSFQAHMAPIDIIFNGKGNQAWVSFHGSWDRSPPVGYTVALIDFDKGMPVKPRNSSNAANFIFSNSNINVCPGQCFRPTGLALDHKGRLWIASDASGEIYVLSKT